MSHLTEIEDPGHEELIFPCDCHNGDYLRITWDDEDPKWRYLWLEGVQQPQRTRRIRTAWRAIRGKQLDVGEVMLSPVSVAALREFLNGKADDA